MPFAISRSVSIPKSMVPRTLNKPKASEDPEVEDIAFAVPQVGKGNATTEHPRARGKYGKYDRDQGSKQEYRRGQQQPGIGVELGRHRGDNDGDDNTVDAHHHVGLVVCQTRQVHLHAVSAAKHGFNAATAAKRFLYPFLVLFQRCLSFMQCLVHRYRYDSGFNSPAHCRKAVPFLR